MAYTDVEAQPLNGEDQIEKLSCGAFCSNIGAAIKAKTGKDWAFTALRIVGLVGCLYFFLFSLVHNTLRTPESRASGPKVYTHTRARAQNRQDLMGAAFKVLGSCDAGGLFQEASNPIAGLMIGILATVLVQSSSTSTSIVVSLVGSGNMNVETAVPVIMGSNIGTSITNTIVSMGQAIDEDQFERAFAGATVHDMFNFLTVLVLLPIEIITGFLRHLTAAMTPTTVAKGEKWVGPIKNWVGPLVDVFIKPDSKVASKIAAGSTTCAAVYEKVATGTGRCGESPAVGIISCKCDDTCAAFFKDKATFDEDMASGAVCLFISLVLLVLCLGILVKILQSMVFGTSSSMLRKATSMNDYLAILVGTGVTILVQSSSITTSVLTPLVGVGVLPLEKMLPLTLGANIGTTFTAILASLVSTKPESVQVALCHLFFNLVGICIWFVVPVMRKVPLNSARGLGAMTRRLKIFPVIYMGFAFVLGPLVLFGVSMLYQLGNAYMVLGVILTVFLVSALGWFVFWWNKRNGKNVFFAMLENQQLRSTTLKTLPTTLHEIQKAIAALEKAQGLASKELTPPMVKVAPKTTQIAPEVREDDKA